MKIRNTFIIFVVSGFWHGANWTFIAWGALNALFFLPLLIMKRNRKNLDIVASGRFLPSIREFLSILMTFSLTVFAWIFFRADSIRHALQYVTDIFSLSLFTIPEFADMRTALSTLILIGAFVIVEWLGREGQYAIEKIGLNWSRQLRYVMYSSILITIFWFWGEDQEFIYFQF